MSEKEKKSKAKKESKTKSTKKSKPKVEVTALEDAPIIGASSEVLGALSEIEETEPGTDSKPKRAHTKQAAAEKLDDSEPTEKAEALPPVLTEEPPPETEPLKLARGAFIALRKSGGMNFSTREVVVYPDGRVAYDARGVPQKEYNRLRRALNDGQVLSLRKLLDQTNFWRAEGSGDQNPDAFAYEIVARLGQRGNEITVFDGSIPESLNPLVERLVKLLPEQENPS